MRQMLRLLPVLLLAAPAFAQAPGGAYPKDQMPDPVPAEQIERGMKDLLRGEEQHAELEGLVRLSWQAIPADPRELAQRFAGTLSDRQVPRGVARDVFARQFEPQARRFLEERLLDLGGLEALTELKIKGKRLPAGSYRIGLAFKGEQPAAFLIQGDNLPRKKPLVLKIKARPDAEPPALLALELLRPEPAKEGEEAPLAASVVFRLQGLQVMSKDLLEPEERPGAKK